ncbi:type I-E CRISPR-associated protein Cas5/CasD [Oenococcus sicerae]|uniref:Type I-E CRISPR-associated protein Cas5/CasD n=1 Tax=Oenococcus sicerae TaxID=2203724 RepID=A0ABX5QP26_9LACO|nr:type I-E CRISPR-associated protein Cas5/CasD [Oenococcus sicerae]QAS70543.1 type I-E CRISPR-associated protein Cas5/CasD [Oenococcus sicerae]
MKTITIKLAGPLQSYGDEAHFSRRTTSDYPSKSAVIGFIAAAFGYRRDDERIAALNSLSFAVRIDQPGIKMTEFQTVEWKKDTRKLTYRDLLQDAIFIVALGSDENSLISKIKNALHHPQFQLYLGRRSNVPAGILKIEEFSDVDPVAALHQLDWQASDWYKKRHRRVETFNAEIFADSDLLSGKYSQLTKDEVESYSQEDRRFRFRSVSHGTIGLPNVFYQEKHFETNHDIFKFL